MKNVLWQLSALILLALAGSAHAQLIPEEICGDGIDNTQAYIGLACPVGWVPAKVNPLTHSVLTPGCDMLCPAPDKDNDRFFPVGSCSAPNCDSDDEDRHITPFSGPTVKGCTGGQVHTPQGDGTFTPCAAWTCPAGRNCKYLSRTGNDTTGDGSIGNPWKSLGKISYWYFTATPPFTLYTPQANDLFVLRGGTYDDLYNFEYSATSANVYQCRLNGAAFGFMAYPGESVIINNASSFNSATWMESCGRQDWKNIQFLTKGIGLNMQGTNIDADNIIAAAPNAEGDNHANILVHSTTDSNIRSAILYDAYKSAAAGSPNPANNSNIVGFRNIGLKVTAPTLFYTSLVLTTNNGDKVGLGAKLEKHAVYAGSVLIDGAVTFNTTYEAIGSGSPNVIIQNSRLGYGNSAAARSANYGGPTQMSGQLNSGTAFDFNQNTVWQMKLGLSRSPTKAYNMNDTPAADDCSGDVTVGTFRVRNNNIQVTTNTYNQDTRFFNQNPYGPDQLRLIGALAFENNTLYSPNATISFGINEANNGNVTCAGRGNDGQSYTLPQWQAAGFDTTLSGSSLENCNMNIFQQCTAPGTEDTGWRALVPTPTPTPTPAPGGPTRGNMIGRFKE